MHTQRLRPPRFLFLRSRLRQEYRALGAAVQRREPVIRSRLNSARAARMPPRLPWLDKARLRRQVSHFRVTRTRVTVIAPPIRVAIWAKGISCIRFAAVRIATSPVPPWPEWQAFTIAVSIGYMLISRPINAPVAINVNTVATIVMRLGIVKAAISLFQGVS